MFREEHMQIERNEESYFDSNMNYGTYGGTGKLDSSNLLKVGRRKNKMEVLWRE